MPKVPAEQYYIMQRIAVRAAREVSEKSFNCSFMFDRGNKTKTFSLIHSEVIGGMHKNHFFPEGSETPFSENQIKLLVEDGMTEYRSSGKKHCPDGGDNKSGKPEEPQTKFQKNCAALCSWQDTADTNSVLGKSKASISEAAEVQQTGIGLKRPSPTFLVSTPSSTTVGSSPNPLLCRTLVKAS